jgi:tRNA nucleotidyltransferase (CCA-adding enzyme)
LIDKHTAVQTDSLKPVLSTLAPDRSDHHLSQLPSQARLFCVGGAVRDALLGESSADRDYLVVGCRPEHLLQAGFVPVGKDFPVFLHPNHHTEYALARTERKTGRGYQGFVFQADESVTLEEDLTRRDLTINALAVDEEGRLHDPHGGLQDLQSKTLRHVSPAFEEDPVRLIRLARFLARWPDFTVAQETRGLCESMVRKGEVDSLVAERVWQEIHKGLQAQRPSAMVRFLEETGAWSRIVGAAPPDREQWALLDAMAQAKTEASIVAGWLLAAGTGHLSKALPKSVQHWQSCFASRGIEALADLAKQFTQEVAASGGRWADLAEHCVAWLGRYDLFRKPEQLEPMVQLVITMKLATPIQINPLAQKLSALVQASMGATAQAAAAAGEDIKAAVRRARCERLTQALPPSSPENTGPSPHQTKGSEARRVDEV